MQKLMQKKLPYQLKMVNVAGKGNDVWGVCVADETCLLNIAIVFYHCRWRSSMRCIVSSGGCVREQSR